jgi:hypothetical protein
MMAGYQPAQDFRFASGTQEGGILDILELSDLFGHVGPLHQKVMQGVVDTVDLLPEIIEGLLTRHGQFHFNPRKGTYSNVGK